MRGRGGKGGKPAPVTSGPAPARFQVLEVALGTPQDCSLEQRRQPALVAWAVDSLRPSGVLRMENMFIPSLELKLLASGMSHLISMASTLPLYPTSVPFHASLQVPVPLCCSQKQPSAHWGLHPPEVLLGIVEVVLPARELVGRLQRRLRFLVIGGAVERVVVRRTSRPALMFTRRVATWARVNFGQLPLLMTMAISVRVSSLAFMFPMKAVSRKRFEWLPVACPRIPAI